MFKAPDGAALRGIAQHDANTWPVYWDERAILSGPHKPEDCVYVADAPQSEWQAVEYDGAFVFEDENQSEWLAHHLIGEDDIPLRDLAVGAAMAEVMARKLASLFDQVREASPKGSPMWNLADSNAAGERLAAAVHRKTFDDAKKVDHDPDPDQWPGGALTGHPDWMPEGADAIVSTFAEGGDRAACLPDLILLGMSQAAAERALDAAVVDETCGNCDAARNAVGGSTHENWQCACCGVWNGGNSA